MPKKLTQEEFIEKAKKVHGDKYNYSLVEYKNMNTKVKIICKEHGIFDQSLGDHLSGYGCKSCGYQMVALQLKGNRESFIAQSAVVHANKYNYSLVAYKNNSTKVKIICSQHGEFSCTPNNHLTGSGCPQCANNQLYSTKEFILKANNKHAYRYDYSRAVYKGSHSKVEIICRDHGSFFQQAFIHLQGQGCPKCRLSTGELMIEYFLRSQKISFDNQYRIPECKRKRALPFDFAVFEDEEKTKLKCLIEYDGEQHYRVCNHFKMTVEDLQKIQEHDKIKTDFCKNNNIKLIRIPYWEKDNIESLLKEFLDSKLNANDYLTIYT